MINKEKNLEIFLSKLEEIDVKFGNEAIDLEKLKNAPYAMNDDTRVAEEGSLLNVVLRTLTPMALKICETVIGDNIAISRESLIKVCLLHQISKSEMFVPNDNQWEVEKRGLKYKYADSDVALKMGMRSLLMCQNAGISFTPEEFEAMTIVDRYFTDPQAQTFSSPLSVVVKQAHELTNLIVREFSKK